MIANSIFTHALETGHYWEDSRDNKLSFELKSISH